MSQIQKMYAIHDQAAGAFLTPFFMANDLLAIRTFAALVNEPNHLFHINPQDFTLFCFSAFDVTEGTLDNEPSPRAVRSGIALVNREPTPGQVEIALDQAAGGNGGEPLTPAQERAVSAIESSLPQED